MSLEEEAALVQGEVRARARLAAASGAREWLAARAGAIEHRQRKSGQFDPRRGLLRAAEMEQRAATVNLRRPHYFGFTVNSDTNSRQSDFKTRPRAQVAVGLAAARVGTASEARAREWDNRARSVGLRDLRAAALSVTSSGEAKQSSGEAVLTQLHERSWLVRFP